MKHKSDLEYRPRVNVANYARNSPHARFETADQLRDLIAAFEEDYGRIYASSAKSPELGYLVTQAVMSGAVDVEKPRLPEQELQSGSPPTKGVRAVYWDDGFVDTDVYEMEDVRNGHTIEGPAVIEAPSTTFAIPPDRRAWIDNHDIFHLENKEFGR